MGGFDRSKEPGLAAGPAGALGVRRAYRGLGKEVRAREGDPGAVPPAAGPLSWKCGAIRGQTSEGSAEGRGGGSVCAIHKGVKRQDGPAPCQWHPEPPAASAGQTDTVESHRISRLTPAFSRTLTPGQAPEASPHSRQGYVVRWVL